MLSVEKTALEGVLVLEPRRFGDARGWFCETWNEARMQEAGLDLVFVQDNQSYSAPRGTLRGLHFQTPPMAQDKLVRVLRGAILDVAVDIREDSPTFGKHVGVELTADNGKQLLVPKGFAHGFVTLVPDTEVFYKVTAPYSPENDKGLAFNDPALGIDWLVPEMELTLSEKDLRHPVLSDLPAYF